MKGYLRRAQDTDRDLLFAWANDEEVRKNSFSMKKISYEEHCRWFSKMMTDDSCRQYIYMDRGLPVGQLRLHVVDGCAQVSYSVSTEWRGRGYGKKMLRELLKEILREELEIKRLSAKVKPHNTASKKVFRDIGFHDKYECFELELEKQQN